MAVVPRVACLTGNLPSMEGSSQPPSAAWLWGLWVTCFDNGG